MFMSAIAITNRRTNSREISLPDDKQRHVVADGINRVCRATVFRRAPTRYRNRHRNFLIPGNARIPPRVAARVGGSERDIYEGDER